MAWERRRQGWFYYRTERAGSRFRKQYFGNGALANLVAHQDELRKIQRTTAARRRREACQQLKTVERTLDHLGELVNAIVAAMAQETEDNAKN